MGKIEGNGNKGETEGVNRSCEKSKERDRTPKEGHLFLGTGKRKNRHSLALKNTVTRGLYPRDAKEKVEKQGKITTVKHGEKCTCQIEEAKEFSLIQQAIFDYRGRRRFSKWN